LGHDALAGGVIATVYDPAARFANEYAPPAPVVVVPIVVPLCESVTVTPERPTISTKTFPLTVPGSEAQLKFAVAV
jgi:hypothetical protein